MDYQDAYTAGFCKMAAAFGVDPQALVKSAQLAGMPKMNDAAPLKAPALSLQGILSRGVKKLQTTPVNAQTGANVGNAFAKFMNRFVTQHNRAVSNMNNFVTGVTNGYQKAIQKTPVVSPNAAGLDRLDKNIQGVTSGRLFDALDRIYQPK